MALTIQIERSTSGVSEGAFSLLSTLPDTGTGFSFDDASVTPGSLYIYRARRRDDTLTAGSQYSDWTALVFVRAAYPFKELPMPCENDIVTGAETEVFVALEPCEGIPTKAAWIAEYLSGSFNRSLMRLFGRALRNAPTMNRKVVRGRNMWEGQFVLEITPEGAFPRFMTATFPVETTALTSPVRYRHRWTNKFGAKSITIIQRKGQTLFVYPGAKVASFELSTSKEQDSVLTATFSVVALDELVYPLGTVPTAPTLLGTGTASTDPLPPYSPVDGVGTLANVVAGLKSITYTITKNLRPDNVFDGKRGARSHFEGKTEVSGSASLNYTSTNLNLQKDFGVTNPAAEYAPGTTLTTSPVVMTFTPPNNGSGFSNILTLALPQADVQTAQPIEGEDEVPENLTFTPIDAIGEAAGTDFYLEITNGESGTSLITPGTALTSVPASASRNYEHGLVNAAPVPTTTAFASTSTHLSSVDSAYVGRSLRFINGANANLTRVISAYTGATRLFTVSVAFTAAPAAGDLFEII